MFYSESWKLESTTTVLAGTAKIEQEISMKPGTQLVYAVSILSLVEVFEEQKKCWGQMSVEMEKIRNIYTINIQKKLSENRNRNNC